MHHAFVKYLFVITFVVYGFRRHMDRKGCAELHYGQRSLIRRPCCIEVVEVESPDEGLTGGCSDLRNLWFRAHLRK